MFCMNRKMWKPSKAQVASLEDTTSTKNIVKISYSILSQNKEYFTNTPTYCKACSGALSVYSKVLEKQDYNKKYQDKIAALNLSDEQKAKLSAIEEEVQFDKNCIVDLGDDESVWVCEFCGVHNRLSSSVIVPQSDDELYLLKRGANQDLEEETKDEATTAEERDLKDDTNLVFCIDVSGSMGDQHQVKSEQYKNMKSVKRIQLITDAVLKQLQSMKTTHPNRKVGLVSFDDRIIMYGDCDKPSHLNQAPMENFERLLQSGEQVNGHLDKPLSESFAKLEKAIKALKPEGTTALGPALLCSLGQVKNKPGSRVIICTDGLANVGLGSLSSNNDIPQKTRDFYNRVGDIAIESGVSISIITVQGNVCRVDALGPLTDRTAGTILRVDPANMDLSDIASNSLIATNVKLRAFIHEGLAFQNTDVHLIHNNGSMLLNNVGSVTENNEVYFEYRVKNHTELEKSEVNLEGLESIPLQTQITYTDLKGNEFIRILSKQQELTKDETEVEKEIKPDILAGYVQKESASLALAGRQKEATSMNRKWTGYMKNALMRNDYKAEEKQIWENFEAENEELCDVIEKSEALKSTKDQLKKDEVVSRLYTAKQKKK